MRLLLLAWEPHAQGQPSLSACASPLVLIGPAQRHTASHSRLQKGPSVPPASAIKGLATSDCYGITSPLVLGRQTILTSRSPGSREKSAGLFYVRNMHPFISMRKKKFPYRKDSP